MANINVTFLSTFCFLLQSQQKNLKDMKFASYSCQYLLQPWLLKHCTSTVVQFLDVIWNFIPILFLIT